MIIKTLSNHKYLLQILRKCDKSSWRLCSEVDSDILDDVF